MVIRVVSVSGRMDLAEIHDIFRAILAWSGDLATSFESAVGSSTASAGRRDQKPRTN